jgi:hypothetical protein
MVIKTSLPISEADLISVEPHMLLFKRLLTLCILFLLLSLAVLIAMGELVGARGEIDTPAASKHDSSYATRQAAVHEFTRRYGPVVFLSTLSVSALAALAVSFSGILPWCRKSSQPQPARDGQTN